MEPSPQDGTDASSLVRSAPRDNPNQSSEVLTATLEARLVLAVSL